MSVYDLYQSYLNQLQNPVVQQSPLFDYRLLYPPVQQDGGDSMGGGITQLSPQQIQDRAMQQEFDASALRDEQGITGLKKDIFILKDNHIRHMHEDIDKIDKKVDTVVSDQKNLLYWIIGAALTTILTLAGLFNLFLK
jgi:tetrahydromethanopterin S-methyltransferase subunit G